MTIKEWNERGKFLFGEEKMQWKFICPVCKHVATPQDWKDAGAKEVNVAFACVGRWLEGTKRTIFNKGKGPCNYSGGGLFQLNPIEVDDQRIFAFYEEKRNEHKKKERPCQKVFLRP